MTEADRARNQGQKLEQHAECQSSNLAQAKALEEAAQAYSYFWPDDAERCRVAAQRYRAHAESAVISSVGYAIARSGLDAALREIPIGEVSSRAGFEREQHEWTALKDIAQRIALRGFILEGPMAQDNIHFTAGNTLQDSIFIAARSSRGMFGQSFRPEDDGQDEIVSIIGALLDIDVDDVPVLRSWLSAVVMALGDTTSYCPTPEMLPVWIVTTTWRKTLLALLVAALTGGISGLAIGGPDPRAVLTGAVGTESAMIINLLSTYLTQPDRKSLSELLKNHDEDEAVIILRLREGPRTCKELATLGGLERKLVLEYLKNLEKEGIVRRLERPSHKARRWELKER